MYAKFLCSLALLFMFSSISACNPDLTARGSASLAWSVTVAGRPATCAAVGATSVALVLHSRSGSDVTTSFPCTDEHGSTPPVVAGPYTATTTLRAADGAVIATAPIQSNATIGADQVTTLAPVVFAVDPQGKLAISVSTLATRANCTAESQGGADMTASVITLEHAFGSCAPVTFTRTRGSTQLGTYTVNCGSPSAVGCVERDETWTAASIPSGAYIIRVAGLRGAQRCWEENDVLAVPGGSAATVKVVQLAPAGAGC